MSKNKDNMTPLELLDEKLAEVEQELQQSKDEFERKQQLKLKKLAKKKSKQAGENKADDDSKPNLKETKKKKQDEEKLIKDETNVNLLIADLHMCKSVMLEKMK
jgi:hypothetical protein